MAAARKNGVDDLVLLSTISEDAIVDNLNKRYSADLIYTYIGDVLISVNPYRAIKDLYGDKVIINYRGRYRYELPPHVYAVADDMYRQLLNERESQCVIISGESGAGKTEAAKKIMEHLAAVTGESPEVQFVKSVVLESNPVLEAFGNAKTVQNNNSSRFGKYMEIVFSGGDPKSGKINNYLLEKSRVVIQNPGERTFHIFYQMMAGLSGNEKSELGLTSPSSFHYTAQSGTETVEGVDDAQDFAETKNAMVAVGISDVEQREVFRLLAGVLWLGNLSFEEKSDGYAKIVDSQVSDFIAALFSLDGSRFNHAMLNRLIETGVDERASVIWSPMTIDQAFYTRDALAKSLYSRLFDWIVARVNQTFERSGYRPNPSDPTIGILDIFGFEIFQNNFFEQMCINFVNEKLQQIFIELTLKKEQEEYASEGIAWSPIEYFNNKIVCELLESKKPPGIFSLLDDVSNFPKGTDEKFRGRIQQDLQNHAHLSFPAENVFTIHHYAGDVTYNIDQFVDKNKDQLFNSLIDLMQGSASGFCVQLFPEQRSLADKKRPTTAGFKIRTPHYIRCIRPNPKKQASNFQTSMVQHQVRYLGLLENVRVRRAGFCYRRPFFRFFHSFKVLSKRKWPKDWTNDMHQNTKTLLDEIIHHHQLPANEFQLGRTKIFIKNPETLFTLQELRERFLDSHAKTIQRAYLRHKNRRYYLERRAAAAALLGGRKERRRASLDRIFLGDYCGYRDNYQMRRLVDTMTGARRGEKAHFADLIVKYDRRFKAMNRTFVVTSKCLFIINLEKDKKNPDKAKREQYIYVVKRFMNLGDISHVTLSPFADNTLIIHHKDPKEHDSLFESRRKVEIIAVIADQLQKNFGTQLQVQIQDNDAYKLKGGSSTNRVKFVQNSSIQNPIVKATIQAPPGLPASSVPSRIEIPEASMPRANGGQKKNNNLNLNNSNGSMKLGVVTPSAKSPTNGSSPGGTPRCKALYPYNAGDNDELSFSEGAVIEILQKIDNDWWIGRLNDSQGLFPASYVEEIKEVAPPARPTPAVKPPAQAQSFRPAPSAMTSAPIARPPPQVQSPPMQARPPTSNTRPAAAPAPTPAPLARPPIQSNTSQPPREARPAPQKLNTGGDMGLAPPGGFGMVRPGELPPFMKKKQEMMRANMTAQYSDGSFGGPGSGMPGGAPGGLPGGPGGGPVAPPRVALPGAGPPRNQFQE